MIKRILSFLILCCAVLAVVGRAGMGLAEHEPQLGPPPGLPTPPVAAVVGSPAVGMEPPGVYLYLPVLAVPPSWVSTQNKAMVRQFYASEYQASEGGAAEWTGNHATCQPGATTPAFQTAVLRRINYFRRMAGMSPLLGFKETYTRKAQAAALMMSVNRDLSHTPPAGWHCYTADGAEGAGSSNLFLGVYGPAAISGYIFDPGSSNYPVGHRRWILYPQTRWMGVGDVPPRDGYPPANALWVFDLEHIWDPRPETREPFVAWPPPGYVPTQVVYPRWSFAYAGADFRQAEVVMTRNGSPVDVALSPVVDGFGENTLVWELTAGLPQPGSGEIVYAVTVRRVMVGGAAQEFRYQVIVFDPDA